MNGSENLHLNLTSDRVKKNQMIILSQYKVFEKSQDLQSLVSIFPVTSAAKG